LYAQYVNRAHGRSEHVWENRFFSCPLDTHHRGRALVYVERNRVRSGLCREAWQWRWSSAVAHCRGTISRGCWTWPRGAGRWTRRSGEGFCGGTRRSGWSTCCGWRPAAVGHSEATGLSPSWRLCWADVFALCSAAAHERKRPRGTHCQREPETTVRPQYCNQGGRINMRGATSRHSRFRSRRPVSSRGNDLGTLPPDPWDSSALGQRQGSEEGHNGVFSRIRLLHLPCELARGVGQGYKNGYSV
jgi:hypothetical protein